MTQPYLRFARYLWQVFKGRSSGGVPISARLSGLMLYCLLYLWNRWEGSDEKPWLLAARSDLDSWQGQWEYFFRHVWSICTEPSVCVCACFYITDCTFAGERREKTTTDSVCCIYHVPQLVPFWCGDHESGQFDLTSHRSPRRRHLCLNPGNELKWGPSSLIFFSGCSRGTLGRHSLKPTAVASSQIVHKHYPT